ncbi:response regulator transcription factor [Sporanaerobium hydrogeniformans]|uniref:response regulator transcription factor n=1 Tax=Sporanaerobium hydrogeniformans TaxID=3072179 RepID=UPI0015D4CD7E|nr:response regulator [Sporanaerobium hydrogeniformans]
MNILMVDDDVLAVEGLKSILNWKSMNISQIYTAYNMKQAQKIFKTNHVDIMICDIEMPKGSGLDLVEWIINEAYSVVIILLTSYANFEYASKAIKMQVKDYLLKPAPKNELEAVIMKAVVQVKEVEKIKDNQKFADYWSSNAVKVYQDLWKDIIFKHKCNELKAIEKMANTIGYSINETNYCPIIVKWKRLKICNETKGNSIIEFVLKNIVAEIFFGVTESKDVFSIDQNTLLVLKTANLKNINVYQEKCQMLINVFVSYYPEYKATCYIKDIVEVNDLSKTVHELLLAEKNDVLKTNRVIALLSQDIKNTSYEKPNMEKWMNEILNDNYAFAIEQVKAFLSSIDCIGFIGLSQFKNDFLQELYILLRKKGIQAHSILKDEQMVELFDKATNSFDDMYMWIDTLLQNITSYSYELEKTPSVVDEIKRYIEENMAKELNRTEMANKVFLHPDYLSHIFKQQMGISISDYIINTRIQAAKRLLKSTNESITNIAIDVGYGNIAYFSRIFKRVTGNTPKEFRNL